MHCVEGTTARQWQITAGHIKRNRSLSKHEDGFQAGPVKEIIFHP